MPLRQPLSCPLFLAPLCPHSPGPPCSCQDSALSTHRAEAAVAHLVAGQSRGVTGRSVGQSRRLPLPQHPAAKPLLSALSFATSLCVQLCYPGCKREEPGESLQKVARRRSVWMMCSLQAWYSLTAGAGEKAEPSILSYSYVACASWLDNLLCQKMEGENS